MGIGMSTGFGSLAISIKSVGDTDGTFSGYGSVFGNVDSYGEVVDQGAFKASLADMKKSGRSIPVLWQHDPASPIGKMTAKEDDHGLACDGSLMIGPIAKANEAYALMKADLVSGLSIGYLVRDSSYDEKADVRHLKAVDLMEVSVVTFPANDAARIEAVKRAMLRGDADHSIRHKFASGQVPTVEEFEQFLRESGCAPDRAAAIASGGIKSLQPRAAFSLANTAAEIRAILGVSS